MIDVQFLLVLIIALLTVNVLFVGVYIVLVLKEVRQSMVKINEMLETASQVAKAIAAPAIAAAGTLEAFAQGIRAIQTLKARKKSQGVRENS